MSALLELAKRVEAATGPDIVLTQDIADYAERVGLLSIGMVIPDYTASLDSAMTLVPEGWGQFDVDATAPELGIDWTLHGPERREAKGTAATPALALCAAALRARASTENTDAN